MALPPCKPIRPRWHIEDDTYRELKEGWAWRSSAGAAISAAVRGHLTLTAWPSTPRRSTARGPGSARPSGASAACAACTSPRWGPALRSFTSRGATPCWPWRTSSACSVCPCARACAPARRRPSSPAAPPVPPPPPARGLCARTGPYEHGQRGVPHPGTRARSPALRWSPPQSTSVGAARAPVCTPSGPPAAPCPRTLPLRRSPASAISNVWALAARPPSFSMSGITHDALKRPRRGWGQAAGAGAQGRRTAAHVLCRGHDGAILVPSGPQY